MLSEPEQTQRVSRSAILAEQLGQQITTVRDRRRQVETQWLYNHAMWVGKRVEERQFYKSPDWRHYIPVGRRAVERITTRATQILVPRQNFIEILPGDETSNTGGPEANALRVYLHYVLGQLHIRHVVSQLVRSILLYQKAIVKVGVSTVDAPVKWGGYSERVFQVWPSVRAVDPFSFYIWPETAIDLDEATLVFEDLMVPWDEYQSFVSRGIALPLNRESLGRPEWPHHYTTRLQHSGIGAPEDTPKQKELAQFVSLSEAWFKSEGRWMQAWLVWNVTPSPQIVRIHRSPYPRPPYREGIARMLPGEHYTSGLGDDVEPLQALFTDQINQGEESRAITAIPPVAVDDLKYPRRDLLVWGPRRFWPGGGVDGVKPIQIPDTSAASTRAAQLTLGLINSLAGAGGFIEGQPTRGLPRSGMAVTSLINLAVADIKDITEILEQDVLSPMLADVYRVTMGFVPQSQIIRIPGTSTFPPRRLSIADLIGAWDFKWLGAQQIQDQQARAQMLIDASRMLAQIEPKLLEAGYRVSWIDLATMVWRDALGERGVETVLQKVAATPPGTETPTGNELLDLLLSQGGQRGPTVGGGSGVSEAAFEGETG